MQGQRSTIDSFPETFELEHGSSSGGTVVDQQLSWNNMLNPGRSLGGWCLGEASSNENAGNHRSEAKVEHPWPSLNTCAGSGPSSGKTCFPKKSRAGNKAAVAIL
ncbi:hypothetical protein IFM89_029091 [Coptis chinensis]|uniref:Uncharacterized protein n=1 Tax=Coptis chinensis TaxID=261450 RepID=A0A835M282_9MAGN|nr:hypothetical protein IFM89_029091 [Coptis chinensis]